LVLNCFKGNELARAKAHYAISCSLTLSPGVRFAIVSELDLFVFLNKFNFNSQLLLNRSKPFAYGAWQKQSWHTSGNISFHPKGQTASKVAEAIHILQYCSIKMDHCQIVV